MQKRDSNNKIQSSFCHNCNFLYLCFSTVPSFLVGTCYTQSTFTCSKLIMETPDKCVESVYCKKIMHSLFKCLTFFTLNRFHAIVMAFPLLTLNKQVSSKFPFRTTFPVYFDDVHNFAVIIVIIDTGNHCKKRGILITNGPLSMSRASLKQLDI